VARYNASIQEKLARSIWNAGCSNWYMNAEGKHTNNWPSFTVDYWVRTRAPELSHFERSVVPLHGSSPALVPGSRSGNGAIVER
jgi:hypothetical protein